MRPQGLKHRPPARLQQLHRARAEERAIRLFAVSLVTHGTPLRSTELHGKRRD
ncbi:MAG TPA: hypothetical protein VLC93_15395 [Myxococcota bacterium]|nr:hypothetical protein [Myxococcota bacterium]